jgi:hypothetical protein
VPVAPAPLLGFRAKRSKVVSRWTLEEIKSSARQTETGKEHDLTLMHWVKFQNVPDYRFAKLNKKIRLLEYTDEEYETLLVDPKWTRGQTDRLITLCKEYDLRFLVVHDRYTFVPPTPPSFIAPLASSDFKAPDVVDPARDGPFPSSEKTVEDLKGRFYTIQKVLSFFPRYAFLACALGNINLTPTRCI